MFRLYKPFYAAGWATKKIVDVFVEKRTGILTILITGGRNAKKDDVSGRLLSAAAAAGKTTFSALAKRPGIQASFESLKMRISTGKREGYEVIDSVNATADRIIALMKEQRVTLRRLAVDGVPGSGKSTLARALAEKLDFRWKTLDYIDMNTPQDFTQERAVYEHHRLLRTQETDHFDAIVYIDEPVEFSKAKCIHRKRGGINIDFFDYDKLKKIGEEAFNAAEGTAHGIPDSYCLVKIRPRTGFRDYERTSDRVTSLGINSAGYSKEELLFLLVYGKADKGLRAYIRLGAYNEELLKGLSAGVLRFLMA